MASGHAAATASLAPAPLKYYEHLPDVLRRSADVLVVQWPADAEAAGTSEIFGTLKILTVVLWLGYRPAALAAALPDLRCCYSWGYSSSTSSGRRIRLETPALGRRQRRHRLGSGMGIGSGGATPADD